MQPQPFIFSGVPPPSPPVGRRRFAEPAKFLPVAFICSTILLLYLIYCLTHGAALLQIGVKKVHVDEEMRSRGIWQLAVFHYITVMLVLCYIRCVVESPGEVPDNDPRWIYIPEGEVRPELMRSLEIAGQQELKRSGQRRHCKWCSKYKPDRCHHCRVCRTCILKMDHHCPWIYNCVGFGNYKYFWLVLFYAVCATHFICWTMWESVSASIMRQDPFMTMFLKVFCFTLAFWLGLILTLFFSFHVWLTLKGMTIIEFCEKSSQPRKGSDGQPLLKSAYISAYNKGCVGNLNAVLGDNPLLWFLPINPPSGDGLVFQTEESRLTMERRPSSATGQQ